MKTITYFNQSWFYMVDEFFLKNLPPDLDLTIKWLNTSSNRFGDTGFRSVCSERMKFVHDTVVSTPDDEILLCLDSDVTFFTPREDATSLSEYITQEMEGYDMAFQDELDGSHNIGIWAIRCNQYVKRWFSDHLEDFRDLSKNDQQTVNAVLQNEKTLVVKNFDPVVFGGVHLNHNHQIFLDPKLRIFHATVFENVVEKCTALSKVRELHRDEKSS